VWHNEKAVGKPVDYDDAFAILRSLSASTHIVITSVCIKSANKETVFSERTRVSFAELSDEQIHYYLENYQPFDKAGAYGIQDWIGLVGISKIEGSYTNVVGLPTEKLYAELAAFAE
jgi:septum formation protein